MDVEDPAVSGHHFQGRQVALPFLEYSRRQTGGVRKCPSGNAVLDPHPMSRSHDGIVAVDGVGGLSW